MSTDRDPYPLRGDSRPWMLKRRKILGKGSFGLATLVEDISGMLLVQKEMNLHMCTKAREMEAIHREIKILKNSSQHPNIVHYIDSCFDEEAKSMYILMEYCDGGDLGQWIERHSVQDRYAEETEVASILVQVLMALKHLHVDQKVLHRDMKPQNIFLMSNGVVKVGDFGVSTILNKSEDCAKTFCGTPFYLAPELCEERPYNGKADVWSTGVILYELLNKGAKPFVGKTLLHLIMAIVSGCFPPIPPTAPYSSGMRRLVEQFLQVDRDARPTVKRLLRAPYFADMARNTKSLLPTILWTDACYNKMFNAPQTVARVEECDDEVVEALDEGRAEFLNRNRRQSLQEARRVGQNEGEAWNIFYKDDSFEVDDEMAACGPLVEPDVLSVHHKSYSQFE